MGQAGFKLPDWPRMMKRATAAAYCDMSIASFEREVSDGRLPLPVSLGGLDHWSRVAIDQHLDRLSGHSEDDWRGRLPVYANG